MIDITPLPQDKNESARSWVYRSILDAIVYLDVEPKTLLDTSDLQTLFNVSRTPLREAMIQLARDGFVELLPQRGSYVSPINLDEVEKARFMRVCLEKELLVQACDECGESDYREMRYILDCHHTAMQGDNIREQHKLDEKFHRVYFTACRRANIWDYLRSSNLHYLRFRTLNIPMLGMQGFTVTHHEDLYNALKRRDKKAAVKVIESHLNIDAWSGKSLVEKNPEWFIFSDVLVAGGK